MQLKHSIVAVLLSSLTAIDGAAIVPTNGLSAAEIAARAADLSTLGQLHRRLLSEDIADPQLTKRQWCWVPNSGSQEGHQICGYCQTTGLDEQCCVFTDMVTGENLQEGCEGGDIGKK
jgi:hypothetical protein